MSGILWSPDEDDRLRNLARSGLSVTEIAHELGRNRTSVYRRAAKLKIVIARDRKPSPGLVEIGLKAKK
jgi:DNA-binding IclR family transcriptional regulator